MSIDKADLKIATAHEIGVRMDDALDAAKSDISRCDGGHVTATKIAVDIEALFAHVNRAVDEGQLDLDGAKSVMAWLTRARDTARDHAARAQQARLMAQGRVAGFEAAVSTVAKFKAEEESKVRAIVEAVRSGAVALEDAGRPPPPLKARRKAVRRAKNA